MCGEKISELANMSWGIVTPELSKDNEFIHVFNHFISTEESLNRTIDFIIGKIIWCNTYLKHNFSHIVVIDDVGQSITDDIREYITKALNSYTFQVKFVSEDKENGL